MADEPIVVAGEAPPWVGPLDVLIVAGDDPGDPALGRGRRDRGAPGRAGCRGGAVRRSAARQHGGARRGAGAAAVRFPMSSGCAATWPRAWPRCRPWTPRLRIDLASLADELDAEALRNSAGRELFTNPAKTLAARISGRRVALAGDCAATMALARHGSSVLLRIAHQVVAATGLADAVVALRATSGQGDAASSVDALFHDEEIDGPLPERLRVLALTLAGERTVVAARVAGLARRLPDRGRGRARCARRLGRICAFTGDDGGRSCRAATGEYWPSGWRWPRFTCDWCGDR